MSVNKYLPHVLVLPEDDANRQLANGFLLHQRIVTRNIQVLEEAGGWIEVLERFRSDHARGMERFSGRHLVMLIDFDGKPERLDHAKAKIPEHLTERVFILGSLTEPEALRSELGSYETIGMTLANDCFAGTGGAWSHSLLRHNSSELERLRRKVAPIVFDA